MTDKIEFANQNISLSSFLQNPQREIAEELLATVLYELEQEGMAHDMLAEVLFEFLWIEMQPDSPVTGEAAVIWLSQLHRFRDKIQSKIDEFEDVYADHD